MRAALLVGAAVIMANSSIFACPRVFRSPPRHPGSKWIESRIEHLPKGKWIAADGNGFVVYSTGLAELYKEIDRAGIGADNIAIFYNPSEDGPKLTRR